MFSSTFAVRKLRVEDGYSPRLGSEFTPAMLARILSVFFTIFRNVYRKWIGHRPLSNLFNSSAIFYASVRSILTGSSLLFLFEPPMGPCPLSVGRFLLHLYLFSD